MQIAVVVNDEQVDEMDRLVPGEFTSRAEVVRTALTVWLAERRAAEIDRLYQEAYEKLPPNDDGIDSGRLGRGKVEAWRDLDW